MTEARVGSALAVVVVSVLVLSGCATDVGSPAVTSRRPELHTPAPMASPTCSAAAPSDVAPGWNETRRDVSEIQALVGAEVDGHYGPATTAKVMVWQQCHGLQPDGVWGAATDAVAFGEADAAIAAAAEAERAAEVEARRWHCVDHTSFDQNAYNDNYCSNAYEARFVSDSEAVRLDPMYVPGQSGDPYYNSK